MQTKQCTRCDCAFPATLENFEPLTLGKYGLHSWCRSCKKRIDAELRERPDQKARQKAWRGANKGKISDYNAMYRAAGYKSTADVARWRARNLERKRQQEASRNRTRRATDVCYRIKQRLSARLWAMLKGKSGRSTEQILGYTAAQLKIHLERQFHDGMTWDDFSAGHIEIDHIVPVREFKISSLDDPDLRACWGLPNLRPMWTEENRAKNGKRLTLL